MPRLFIFFVFSLLLHSIFAQEDSKFHFDVINTSEIQSNFSDRNERKPKGLNLLELESRIPTSRFWKNGLFEVWFWGTAQTQKHHIADDVLMFSNLEAGNLFICSKLGYRHTINNFSLFVGIHNPNSDYFISPYTSLFTNSSAGIFPTISMNYGVANFPLAAFGIHGEYKGKNVSIKNSFYNNLNDLNEKQVFKFQFDPAKHGYTNISQVEYTSSSGIYAIGSVLEKLPKQNIDGSLFVLAEQSVAKFAERELGVMAQFGYAPKNRSHTHLFWGAGAVLSGLLGDSERDMLGVNVYGARTQTHTSHEVGVELTYRYLFNSTIALQPALHYVNNNHSSSLLGLARVIVTFGN